MTGKDTVDLFDVTIPVASDSERRVVRAIITPSKSTDRLYVGQRIECTGPSQQTITGIQTGRNVVPDEKDQRVIAQFVFSPDEAGDWHCVSKARVCNPGQCSNGSAPGKVTLDVSKDVNDRPTRMAVSQPLPDWTQENRAGDDDILIQSGDTGTLSTTINDIPLDQGPVQFLGTISLTNCIESTYPDACKDAKKSALQEYSKIHPVFTFTQTGGDGCTTVTATEKQGAYDQDISWKQHHGTYWFLVPNISLNPDCDGTVKVDLAFTVNSGNAAVIERGTSGQPMSVIGLVPSNPDLA